ncbi:hypothetical protein CONPUDRAFT_134976 [Coniophora puteana RWD-64-598 SS2]|uniref:DUF7904 domain-containing protein n=1 Tax=Coniophora puteana (strain RWD-64-598) TaxID=741705 RepID=A0A5M3N2L4_CONPW|nr:uncharacterized protein CONPUDRAFT_134976 [Coniophora puteana RWD-64-598 SS2]EIW85151.1 hypothetical protein CONPUDRAFT_134976 [Coniophora puteana RWD-64-598 SS2]
MSVHDPWTMSHPGTHPTRPSRFDLPSPSTHPSTINDSGLAEWTTRIRAMQAQVDADDEAEQRRLEDEIARARLARMRRSRTGQSGDFGVGVHDSNLDDPDHDHASKAATPEASPRLTDSPKPPPIISNGRVTTPDPIARPASRSRPTPPSPSAPRPSWRPPSRTASTSPSSSKPPLSLAAFVGGNATGPRLNKHAPQADPSAMHDGRSSEDAIHPVFGKGGIAMPGMNGRGVPASTDTDSPTETPSSRGGTPVIRAANSRVEALASKTPTRQRTQSTSSVAQRYVERLEGQAQSHKPGSPLGSKRERRISTPAGSLASPSLSQSSASFPSPAKASRPASMLPPASSPAPGTPPPRPWSRQKHAASSVSGPTRTKPSLTSAPTPPPKSPEHTAPASISPTSSLGQSTSSPTNANANSSSSKPFSPQPQRGLSPAFLKPPAASSEKNPTPSLSRLQGRGFVASIVQQSGKLEAVSQKQPAGIQAFFQGQGQGMPGRQKTKSPAPAKTAAFTPASPGKEKPSKRNAVLDRWQPHSVTEKKVAPPAAPPKPIALISRSRSNTADDSQHQNGVKLEAASPKPMGRSRASTTNDSSTPSSPKQQQQVQKQAQWQGQPQKVKKHDTGRSARSTTSQLKDDDDGEIGSAQTLISYIKPVKTGDESASVVSVEAPTPPVEAEAEAAPHVDEMGVRNANAPVQTPRAIAGRKTPEKQPLSHPTRERARKPPRKGKSEISAVLPIESNGPDADNQGSRSGSTLATETAEAAEATPEPTSDKSDRAAALDDQQTQTSPAPQAKELDELKEVAKRPDDASNARDAKSKRRAGQASIGLGARPRPTATPDRQALPELAIPPPAAPPAPAQGAVPFPSAPERPSTPKSEKSSRETIPPSPSRARHSRIPSTGSRALVMDIAKAFNEVAEKEEAEASGRSTPVSALSSASVSAASSLSAASAGSAQALAPPSPVLTAPRTPPSPSALLTAPYAYAPRSTSPLALSQPSSPVVPRSPLLTPPETLASASSISGHTASTLTVTPSGLPTPTSSILTSNIVPAGTTGAVPRPRASRPMSPQQVERRRSSYDRYSAIMMPPLPESDSETDGYSPPGTMAMSSVELDAERFLSGSRGAPEEAGDDGAEGVEKEDADATLKQAVDEIVQLDIMPIDVDAIPTPDVSPLTEYMPYTPDTDLTTVSVEVLSIGDGSSAPASIPLPDTPPSSPTGVRMKQTRSATVFYDTELLAVVHRARSASAGLVRTAVYAWVGHRAPGGPRAGKRLNEMARRYGTALQVMRQGAETSEFLGVLGGSIAVRQGTRAHWSAEDTAMHVVRQTKDGSVVIDEVELGVRSLCSAYTSVLRVLDSVFVWAGRGSPALERTAGLAYAQSLASSDIPGLGANVIEIEEGVNDDREGGEAELFWMVLGLGEHANAAHWRWRGELSAGHVEVEARAWVVPKDVYANMEEVSLVEFVRGPAGRVLQRKATGGHSRNGSSVGVSSVSTNGRTNGHAHDGDVDGDVEAGLATVVLVLDCIWEVFVVVGRDARGERERISRAVKAAEALSARVEHARPFLPPVHVLVAPTLFPRDLLAAFMARGLVEDQVNGGETPEHMNILTLSEAKAQLNQTAWPRSALGEETLLSLGIAPGDVIDV